MKGHTATAVELLLEEALITVVPLKFRFSTETDPILACLPPPISTFGITTDDPDRDYFNLGLGVTGTFANGKSAYLMYETVLDRDHVNVYSIAFGGRMEF